MYKIYLRNLTLFSVAIGLLVFGLGFLFPSLYLPVYLLVILYFFGITADEHFFFIRQTNKDSRKFVNLTMLTSAIKFLLHLCFILLYVFLRKEEILKFVLFFAILYGIFLFYDTRVKMKLSKK